MQSEVPPLTLSNQFANPNRGDTGCDCLAGELPAIMMKEGYQRASTREVQDALKVERNIETLQVLNMNTIEYSNRVYPMRRSVIVAPAMVVMDRCSNIVK